jgi:HAD superfamily hydrolase (TIGR01459 family)
MTLPLTGFAEISGRYDALICDIWGVVHNGINPWPQAGEALIAFRQRGGAVVMLSNSPRPSAGVQAQMAEIGVPKDCYDSTVTSGDLTRALLSGGAADQVGGKKVHHLGPPRDNGIYGGLEIDLVSAEEAEIALVTGLVDDNTETPDDYADLLKLYLTRGLTMVCANPDLIVERGDRLVYCAGALAERYEQMGGPVIWAGKPHAPAYTQSLRQIVAAAGGDVPKERILAIGDSLRTDIAGGAAFGVDTLLIAAGIHTADFVTTRDDSPHSDISESKEPGGAGLDLDAIAALSEQAGARPTYVMSRLKL